MTPKAYQRPWLSDTMRLMLLSMAGVCCGALLSATLLRQPSPPCVCAPAPQSSFAAPPASPPTHSGGGGGGGSGGALADVSAQCSAVDAANARGWSSGIAFELAHHDGWIAGNPEQLPAGEWFQRERASKLAGATVSPYDQWICVLLQRVGLAPKIVLDHGGWGRGKRGAGQRAEGKGDTGCSGKRSTCSEARAVACSCCGSMCSTA